MFYCSSEEAGYEENDSYYTVHNLFWKRLLIMLTIFSIPKPFNGHIGVIQKNALTSWLRLSGCEVILFGDDEGVEETAAKLGTKYVCEVRKNEYGTPLLDFVFEHAEELAENDTLCYVNADIILPSDFLSVLKQIRFKKFLIAGQRWDVNIDQPWDFESADREEKLRSHIAREGSLHPPLGSDYFVFPKGTLGKLPPFAVGRPGWDNWVISRTKALRIPVIDATQVMTVVHQNHNYCHVPKGTGKDYLGPEADRNLALIGSKNFVFTLEDVDWVLTPQGLHRPKWTRKRLKRFILSLPVIYPRLCLPLSAGLSFCSSVKKILGIRNK
jgi:hypothetical protein